MKLFQKIPELLTLPTLGIVYFITRLLNLMSLPIFTDEAIYTRWAQIARLDSNWRFISLTDGKQPSFVWADMIFMKFFSDPLMAGRVVSVLAGFVTMLGIYFLTTEIFKGNEKKMSSRVMGIIAAALYVFFPFALVYDRMAIYDSLVAAFFVWALYFQILLVRKIRLDIAMVLGFVLGGAVLTKSSGFLSIYLTPFLLFLFDFNKKDKAQKIFRFGIFALVGIVIANGMYSILRLSPFFHIISQKNTIFVYTISGWMNLSLTDKIGNFLSSGSGLLNWFVTYVTLPYILLAAGSFLLGYNFLREKIVLLLWFFIPFILLCVFGKTLYPRYILFMVMPLLPLIAYSLFTIFEKYKSLFLRAGIVLVIAALPLRMFYYVLFDFAHAPIPSSDMEQYVNGWPSGGGVRESVEFFKEQAKNGKIYIATQGTFGLMPASYEIYLSYNKNISLKGFWPTNELIDTEVSNKAKLIPTYFVFYQDCPVCQSPGIAPTTWPLTLVKSYAKGIGTTRLNVYQVKSL